MHNLTPHCHHQALETADSTHQHRENWWSLLLNHHPEGVHGDDEIVKFLRASDDESTNVAFHFELDGPLLTLPPNLPSVEQLLRYYSIAVPGKPCYLTATESPITSDVCRLSIGRAPPKTMNI